MRLGIGCGCLSIIVAVAALILVVVVPSVVTDNQGINQLMGRIFCGDPDAYINSSESYSYRPGETSFYLNAGCRKPDNVVEDVTGTQTLAGMGVFFVALFGGIGLIIFTSIRGAARTVRNTLSINGVQLGDLSAKLNQQRPIVISTSTMGSGKPAETETLAEKLRQLDESYEARLISKEEYDDARKRLINNF